MNRITLVVLGVASAMWMLRDLSTVDDPPAGGLQQAGAVCSAEFASARPPSAAAPHVMPRQARTIQQVPPTPDIAPTIEAVKYTAPLTDLPSPAEADQTDPAFAPAPLSADERAALGKWATGVLDALIAKPAAMAAAAATAIQETAKSVGVANQQGGPVVKRNAAAGPPAALAPAAKDVRATDEPEEKTAEKPVDMERPAVTIAAPEGTLVTIERPTTAAATPSGAAQSAAPPKAQASVASSAPLSAATTPPRATPIAPVAPVRPPLSPAMVALSQKVHYALGMYQHQRLLNTGTNACWEVMHRFVAFGAATEVFRDSRSGEPVNAIGWLLWGGRCNSQPLLVLSGGKPMATVGVGVQGHPGQFLGMLAQSHVRPESPFQLQGQQFTVRDLIEQEKLDCDSNIELTFELIAMSYYLKSDDVWTSRNGEQWSISRLVHEEIQQPINGAACGGSHRLFGLSSAYKMRISQGKPVDGEFLRAQRYIRSYQSYALGTIHNRDGSFSTDWFRRPADNGDLDRKIQTTGHILEWLVFSLDDSQLRDPRVVQSVDFLATQIVGYPNRAWSIGPLGHALHALAIYESRVFALPDSHRQRPPAEAAPQVTSELTPFPPLQAQPRQAVASRQVIAPRQVSVPPQPKADAARPGGRSAAHPAARPPAGTPNAAAATAELEGPDLGVTR